MVREERPWAISAGSDGFADQLKHLYYEERNALSKSARQEELATDRSVGPTLLMGA